MISIRLRRLIGRLSCLTGPAKRLSARGARLDAFVFQRIPEPAGIMAVISQRPNRLRQTARQRRRAGVIANLTCGREDAQWAPIGIGYGMQPAGHAALCSADQTAPLDALPCFAAGWRPCATP
jgi:hypothetical protein